MFVSFSKAVFVLFLSARKSPVKEEESLLLPDYRSGQEFSHLFEDTWYLQQRSWTLILISMWSQGSLLAVKVFDFKAFHLNSKINLKYWIREACLQQLGICFEQAMKKSHFAKLRALQSLYQKACWLLYVLGWACFTWKNLCIETMRKDMDKNQKKQTVVASQAHSLGNIMWERIWKWKLGRVQQCLRKWRDDDRRRMPWVSAVL